MNKPILCLDFDGVCHSYYSGWQGVTNICDPPVEGLFEFLLEAVKHFSVHVYSSRSHQEGGIDAMYSWFKKHFQEWQKIHTPFYYPDFITVFNIQFPTEKPPAMVTLDDRAITFTGTWPSVFALKDFKPWNLE